MVKSILLASSVCLLGMLNTSFAKDQLNIGPVKDQWRKLRVVEIPEGEHFLKQNATISADILKLKGTLYTLGHALNIDVKKIEVADEGSIRGFRNSDKDLLFHPPAAPDQKTRGKDGRGTGAHGQEGPQGHQGLDGRDGRHDSQPIQVFAEKIEGDLRLTAQGENGQSGQKGGRGGRGGDGAQGRHGKVHKVSCKWLFVPDGAVDHGGRGGNSGYPGWGGRGGSGGNGGNPIRVSLLSTNEKTLSSVRLQSLKGLAGKPGAPGELGPKGRPGPGGNPDEKSKDCFFDKKTFKANSGSPGSTLTRTLTAQKEKELTGKKGEDYIGDLSEKEEKFNLKRTYKRKDQVRKRAVSYHYERSFKALIERTLNYAFQNEMTLEQIQALDEERMRGMLLEVDRKMATKLRKDWLRSFVYPLEQKREQKILEGESTDEIDYKIDIANRLARILKNSTKHSSDEIHQVADQTQFELSSKLRSFNTSCLLYLRAKKASLTRAPFLGSSLEIPACQRSQLERLANNPFGEIQLSLKPATQAISPLNALEGYQVYDLGTEGTNERKVSQAYGFHVVIIDGQTYRQDSLDMLDSLRSQDESKDHQFVGLSNLEKKEIEIEEINSYLKVLAHVE